MAGLLDDHVEAAQQALDSREALVTETQAAQLEAAMEAARNAPPESPGLRSLRTVQPRDARPPNPGNGARWNPRLEAWTWGG